VFNPLNRFPSKRPDRTPRARVSRQRSPPAVIVKKQPDTSLSLETGSPSARRLDSLLAIAA